LAAEKTIKIARGRARARVRTVSIVLPSFLVINFIIVSLTSNTKLSGANPPEKLRSSIIAMRSFEDVHTAIVARTAP
jgi:hypothetical protein